MLKFSTSYAPEVKTTPVQQWSVSNDYNDLEVDHHRPGGDAYRDELPLGASEVVDHRYYSYEPAQKAVNIMSLFPSPQCYSSASLRNSSERLTILPCIDYDLFSAAGTFYGLW